VRIFLSHRASKNVQISTIIPPLSSLEDATTLSEIDELIRFGDKFHSIRKYEEALRCYDEVVVSTITTIVK